VNLGLPIRAAWLYVWYPQAWALDQNNGQPETVYHPTLGVYASADPAVIDQQAAWGIHANLDAFIVSWWGQGPGTDAVFQEILARAAGGVGPTSQMQYAIYYEQEAYQQPSVATIVADLAYLARTAFAQPNYLRVNGQPVVFVYGAQFSSDAVSRWEQAKAQFGGNVYLSLDIQNVPGGTTIDSWHNYGTTSRIQDYRPYSMAVSPGFWRWADHGAPRLGRDPAAFSSALAQIVAAHPDWQLVGTWNEWGEGSGVEPSSEYGTQYIDLLGAGLMARQQVCIPWGQPCNPGQACCLGSCVGGTCYVPDGGSCAGNPNLCIPGHVCLNATCQPYNPTCGTLNSFCFQNQQCCSGICNGQLCANGPGGPCVTGNDCGPGLACVGGICDPPPCGALGEPCCPGSACDAGLICGVSGYCTPPPKVTIDVPAADQLLLVPTVPKGWALDPAATTDTGISDIQPWLDGPPGQGTLLAPIQLYDRPDVAAVYGANFLHSGWLAPTFDPTTVAPGPHLLSVYARSSLTGGWQQTTTPFLTGCQVACDCPPCSAGTTSACKSGHCGCVVGVPPRLQVDVPSPGQQIGGTATLFGWALDPLACAHDGVDRLLAFLDGDVNTGAPLGPVVRVTRPDVAAVFGPQFINAGWQVIWDSTTVAPGPHTFTAYARSGLSQLWETMTVAFVVVAPPPVCTDPSQCPPCGPCQAQTCAGGMCGCGPTVGCTDPSQCPACGPCQEATCLGCQCGCATTGCTDPSQCPACPAGQVPTCANCTCGCGTGPPPAENLLPWALAGLGLGALAILGLAERRG
jgi:glycoprotein endo-alpha-1,2-mannosidase